jgi:hypothetical protein
LKRRTFFSLLVTNTWPCLSLKGDADFIARMFFDLSFFVIVGVLLFNIITGLMVDGFGALRDEANQRAEVNFEQTQVRLLLRQPSVNVPLCSHSKGVGERLLCVRLHP